MERHSQAILEIVRRFALPEFSDIQEDEKRIERRRRVGRIINEKLVQLRREPSLPSRISSQAMKEVTNTQIPQYVCLSNQKMGTILWNQGTVIESSKAKYAAVNLLGERGFGAVYK
ncbi:hypothetical protein KIN20_023327 [Parelaphostrongylus tenuis]|uniref:Uncharacterized protein n=1 Tax=Parelaphostrongylus tenuis TaxID=148309 RepID=A0AAD5NA02_PARTN|nr:hypothetical protein KIN20_023327 [Parelaphostrongylus tenuis]